MNWDFLAPLAKAPKVFSAAVALGAAVAVAWSLRLFGLPTIDATGLTFAALGATALAYFLFSTSVHAWQHLRKQVRLAPISKLSEEQRVFLLAVYASRDREFTVRHSQKSQNWIVGLRELGYVDIAWGGSEGTRYRVTPPAWTKLEKEFSG